MLRNFFFVVMCLLAFPKYMLAQAVAEYPKKVHDFGVVAETSDSVACEFKVVNVLVTNFHQPQSTLLLLISAFVKGDWHRIYDFALANDFRFLSYGDSSVLFRR